MARGFSPAFAGLRSVWKNAAFYRTQSTPRILSVFFSAVSAVNGFFTGSEGLRHSKLVKMRR
ncbi:MAG: hypothetical protein DMF92_11205 [Acidobacteria bacterium]|nr:MAG: hypothetical protein DMF92_11205 [Acidobacteriota bacterium]